MFVRSVFILAYALTSVSAAEFKIFDGSKREILYQTSSHAGHRELAELLQLVPGGEGFTVLKMPYNWAKTPEKNPCLPGYRRTPG